MSRDYRIGVIGLGYVGLPLAVEFGKHYEVIGFDIKSQRIEELRKGQDVTLEVGSEELAEAWQLRFSNNAEDLASCNIYIVTVPTPIDAHKRPDLTPLIKASETIGKVLKKGDIVIYESTVYPGATEEDCVPVLERVSGLVFNIDFFAGYSPERINPGDKEHRLPNIKKITSGSTPEITDKVDALYRTIITAGTHKASNIVEVEVYDRLVNAKGTQQKYGIQLTAEPQNEKYDGVVITVAHQCFKELGADCIRQYSNSNSALFDLKYTVEKKAADFRL